MPHSQRKCLTQEEAQTVYECLAAEQVVSPIHFNKAIAKAPNFKKLAYQKLEEILEEEGSVNPYQLMISSPDEETTSQDPFLHIDYYQAGPSSLNCINTQNMENWSVLSTKMHYADPPQGHHNLMVMDCKTALLSEWDKSGKGPSITSDNIPDLDKLAPSWISLTASQLKLATQESLLCEDYCQDYYVIGSILFKYLPLKGGELDSVMCISPSKMDCILDYYHTVIGGHMGMTKTLKTLSTRYFVLGWLITSELTLLDVICASFSRIPKDFTDHS